MLTSYEDMRDARAKAWDREKAWKMFMETFNNQEERKPGSQSVKEVNTDDQLSNDVKHLYGSY